MRYLLPAVITVLLFSCNSEVPETMMVKQPEDVQKSVSNLLSKYLESTDTNSRIVLAGDTLFATPALAYFFKRKNYEPVFSAGGRFNGKFYMMRRVVRDAREFGLLPSHYHWQKLDSFSRTVYDVKEGTYDAVKLADIELFLADAFCVMAHHLYHGRLDPDSLRPFWKRVIPDSLMVHKLDSALNTGHVSSTLTTFEPKFRQYVDLKASYKAYRKKMQDVKWTDMPDIKADTAKYMSLVKVRMIEMGYYDSTKKGNDSVLLSKALRKFQKEYHLTEDGKVGKEMVKALAYNVEDRYRQIEMNLERWRTEKRKNDKVYVWVNLAGFKLTVAEKDTIAVESRIICGDPKHPSPTPLKSIIMYFTIYPYWNVPYSIASKEILPRIKWDTAYIRKQRFEVIDWKGNIVDHRKINWKKYGEKTLPYKFRQREGEENSLGVVKFFFNNKAGVYLHDTNAKKLFKREVRCLSHGCMRLEEYMAFAEFLVRDDSVKIPKDTLHAWFGRPEQRIVNLKKPVPLYIKYYTNEVLFRDQLQFYPDMYGHDEKMVKALAY